MNPVPESPMVGMAARSRRGLVVGLTIALVIPVSYWVLAQLVELRIAPYDQTHALLGAFETIALLELVLGPVGIGIVGVSGDARTVPVWLALILLGVPTLFFVWLLGVATLSGALGNPF